LRKPDYVYFNGEDEVHPYSQRTIIHLTLKI
jgi:hypothetical protein